MLLAVDREKQLGEEEMKILLSEQWNAAANQQGDRPRERRRASTSASRSSSRPRPSPLADALEATWRREPSLYYEDGFQELADRGGEIHVAPIGAVDWVEVDDHGDLARARELAFPS